MARGGKLVKNALPQVEIYTDGGCEPNPGPGGWGAVLVSGPHVREISGAEAATTNNRMELTAAIAALRLLKSPCKVDLYTDSAYLRRGITTWLPGWRARGWRKADGRPVENADLWQALAREAERHHITWHWVKGHTGHPMNERADQLATQARKRLQAGGEQPAPPERASHCVSAEGSCLSRDLPSVDIYLRGSSLGQPGPAGYAAVIVHKPKGDERLVCGGWPLATNNAMELWAAVAGLKALERPSRVTLYTTSRYLLEGAQHQLAAWERSNWRTQSGRPLKHSELWQELCRAMGDHDLDWRYLASGENEPHSRHAAAAARAEAEKMKRGHPASE